MDLQDHAVAVMNVVLAALSKLGQTDPGALDIIPKTIIGDSDWADCCGTATISMGTISPSRYNRSAVSSASGCARFDVPWTIEIVGCLGFNEDGSYGEGELERSVRESLSRIDALLCAAAESEFTVWVTSAQTVGPDSGCVSARVELRTLQEICG
jgi:hypothetical protein